MPGGEHLTAERGSYSAWAYVVVGFLLSVGAMGLVLQLAISSVLAMNDTFLHHDTQNTLLFLGFAVGGVISFFVYRDRWRVNEAFTSRFLSGVMQLSMLYAPALSMIYAYFRGIQKFKKR